MNLIEKEFEKYKELQTKNGELKSLLITISCYGEMRKSRWGYSGADPDEYPELTIESIEDIETGNFLSEDVFCQSDIEKFLSDLLEEVLEEFRQEQEECFNYGL